MKENGNKKIAPKQNEELEPKSSGIKADVTKRDQFSGKESEEMICMKREEKTCMT